MTVRPRLWDWCFHDIIPNTAFACVFMLIQQAGSSSAKKVEKGRAGNCFQSFWDNINQLMTDYLKI